MLISLLFNMKMPPIVGIFIFINRENFMLISLLFNTLFIFVSREYFMLS